MVNKCMYFYSDGSKTKVPTKTNKLENSRLKRDSRRPATYLIYKIQTAVPEGPIPWARARLSSPGSKDPGAAVCVSGGGVKVRLSGEGAFSHLISPQGPAGGERDPESNFLRKISEPLT